MVNFLRKGPSLLKVFKLAHSKVTNNLYMLGKNAAIHVQLQNPKYWRAKKVIILLGLWLSCQGLLAQGRKGFWIDSVFQTLSVPEKIGQIFMVPVSNINEDQSAALLNKIKTYHLGGLRITNAGHLTNTRIKPEVLANLLNRIQGVTKVPLMFGINAESGLTETLDSTMGFFRPLELDAIRNDSLNYRVGETIAEQTRMLGLHINFGPHIGTGTITGVDDEAPISESNLRVAEKSGWLVRGLQDHGVIACARRHPSVPGHLNPKDHSVPTNLQPDTSLYSLAQLARQGIGGVMTTDFSLIRLNEKMSVSTAQSSVFIREIIRKKIGFNGLAFADVAALRRVADDKKNGEAELLAFAMGNDVLLSLENPAPAIRKITKEIKRNKTLMAQLDASVKRILGAKYDVGLGRYHPVDTDNLLRRLHSAAARLFKHQLAEAVVTVVKNTALSIPVQSLQGKTFTSLTIGADSQNEFNRYLTKYVDIQKLSVHNPSDTTGLASRLGNSTVIIVGIFTRTPALFSGFIPILQKLAGSREVIICHFGNPADIKYFEHLPTIIAAYSDDHLIQGITAQIIFGGLSAKGVMPVSVGKLIRAGEGITTSTFDRFSYTLPEAAGMDGETLEQIKSIAREAIDLKATPGCHVLVARGGKVVYEQSFGALTYENKIPVTDETLYDLASVTKVSATLQTVMYLYEKGFIDINKKVSVYLPELKTSNKRDFTIKDILTHQAGLWPFLPFWMTTVKDSVQLPQYYSKTASTDYPFPVAQDLFATRSMKDSLWQWIINAKIRDKTGRTPYDYRYSDMGFYILQHLAEKILGQPMEQFLKLNIYEPLGAYTTGYLPLRKFSPERIAPTENDKTFRRSLLVGYVHDQGAAMHGGIAGHAGLFSTANDLAKLGQMWLQKGTYGGHRYFQPETIEFFTRKQYENSRRGLGWDKPTQGDTNGPTSAFASPQTFGHTGFTGISIWVDPAFNLVFIFFSNRVYPNMTNTKILDANIRPRVQDVVYKSIFKYCENHP